MVELILNKHLIWQSDWAGDEVGHEMVNIVGLYSLAINPAISFYINMETMEVLEAFFMDDDI